MQKARKESFQCRQQEPRAACPVWIGWAPHRHEEPSDRAHTVQVNPACGVPERDRAIAPLRLAAPGQRQMRIGTPLSIRPDQFASGC